MWQAPTIPPPRLRHCSSYPCRTNQSLHTHLPDWFVYPWTLWILVLYKPLLPDHSSHLSWASRGRHLPLGRDSSLHRAKLPVCKLCLPPHRPKCSGRRNSNSSPPRYRSSRCTCPGSEAPGNNCYTDYIGWQTGEDPGGLPLTFPAPNQEGPVCLLGWWAARLNGGGPERQARRLELEAYHDQGQAPAWSRQQKVLFDIWSGQPHHYSLQSVCHSRCLGHRLNQGPRDPGESDCLLGTQLGPPPSTDRHYMSFKLPNSAWPPGLQTGRLVQIPGTPGGEASVQFGTPRQGGCRHVCPGFD